ncbi:hypothetical protein [Paenibacillus pini]|uniref:Uncharacterized protein n=1 Tax=Paenibacillus pini JCM 16418 TaxID=1236976 RepID=W7YHL4_9BACL|nr:hypothetical protein [Paenibacillus pini]GAF10405.1 hypothetical protein JCM16418_4608 [Paenibacillus pini JCM 16418]
MIVIALLFGCILWLEWRYMHLRQRKKRTFVIVIAMGIAVCICLEALHYFNGQWAMAQVIEMVFDPVEKFMHIGN